ncbi:metal ABC transporter permease [Neoehrlichia mikurensis]|uniref:Metal ABC transporter permease n=1 Tax=Neoehrlichia mikurensis TaxID=89586 RepID=A0A9Q9F3K4_9RICK|nr:metal ABC transporter permease [Neoehrlichia mikurensis]QXK91879.1 metal ABC transporter permease [Neoehrlichia mikurensis]QXK93092.1 metal ABC transporter permease [Neoehrlichia mikurensis]QXK93572.1 metal ABC transporter permease [Neoehrlichia mikurensis]UTO55475.1 metal ABC transporter permease [Neoehrlichia mikurensis]UTO56395.1 metal ABC transporter permease [Neoehrlichia mikurensis]
MLETISERFFINALVAMFIISIVTGPLGSCMIWHRFSYLGDSIAHSSFLGIALATIFQINMLVSILVIAVVLAILISLNFEKIYSTDTMLNIITNVIMSIGIVLLSFVSFVNSDIIHSLFGDILMVSNNDLIKMLITAIVVIFVVIYRWKNWLFVSVSQDLSMSSGINVNAVRLEFLIILSVFIAFYTQLVGILLITAFLVIPAAGARLITSTPMQMMVAATVISVISGTGGLLLSVIFDIFPGPLIIILSFLLLLIMYFIRRKIK